MAHFYKTRDDCGQWLWLSWQSGCLLYKRSTFRIQTLAKFYNNVYILYLILSYDFKVSN